MKKVKIILLPLTLLALVGGALAFKEIFDSTWCITNEYSFKAVSQPTIYYSDFDRGGALGITTTSCGAAAILM